MSQEAQIEEMEQQDSEDLEFQQHAEAAQKADAEAEPPKLDLPQREPEPETPKEEPKEEAQTVPLATLLEERKQFQAKVDNLTSTIGQLKESIEAVKPQPEPPAPAPDPEEDPFGHLRHKQEQMQKTVEQISEGQKAQAEQSQQQAALAEMQRVETEFVNANPDYFDAMEHLKNWRLQQFAVAGVEGQAAMQAFNNEAAWLIQTAVQNGKNFAEVAYDYAKAAGWQTKQTETDTNKADTKATDSLKAIAKAQEQSATLSAATGKTGPVEAGPAEISDLTDKDFDSKFVGADNEDNWRKLMG